MTGWFMDLLINDLNRHNFDVMTAFRFHLYYVNRMFLCCFHNMLQSLLSGRVVGIGEVFCFKEYDRVEVVTEVFSGNDNNQPINWVEK